MSYQMNSQANTHAGTPNEFLMMGFIALSLGPNNATQLYNKFVGSRDFSRAPAGILRYADASYRSTARPDIVLDYYADRKGTVVQQNMWQPVHNGDVSRHVHDAKILEPVFFIRLDNVIGVDLAQVLRAPRPGTPLNIFYSEAPAPLGGLATTHLCIKWPGYAQEFRKQVEIKDHSRLPITRSKLVERIAKFVEKFIEEAASWPIDRDNAHWRVGPRYINKDHLYIVGLIHVSAGCWQPILQLKSLNWPLV